VGIPLTVGFRPQLVVVSGLSVGVPLMVGFRPELVVVSGLSVGISLSVGFRLSRSLWLSKSPFTNSSYFMMELWLSRSLSHKLFFFSRWNFGYHEAFLRTFLLHNGILAITKPFYQLLFYKMEFWLSRSLFTIFFHTVESRLAWSLSRIFLSHGRISAIIEPFHEFFFHTMEFWLS
jgi:hypothetical protein